MCYVPIPPFTHPVMLQGDGHLSAGSAQRAHVLHDVFHRMRVLVGLSSSSGAPYASDGRVTNRWGMESIYVCWPSCLSHVLIWRLWHSLQMQYVVAGWHTSYAAWPPTWVLAHNRAVAAAASAHACLQVPALPRQGPPAV